MRTSPKTITRRLRAVCAQKFIPVMLLLALPSVVHAQFTYTTVSGKITITGYTGPGGAVTIPDKINGLPVTSIGDYAFESCTNLTSITIGTNVAIIGTGAFASCTSLTNIAVPMSVTSIGAGAFDYCDNLTEITVDPLNLAYSSLDGVLFNQSQTTLIECPGGKTGSYTVPTSVTSLAQSSFNYCYNLTSVTIGANVTNIGNYAFDSCGSLTNITVPMSVTSIGAGAFASCDNLTEITVDPLNLAYSSLDGVLFNQSQTTLIECPGGKTGSYTVPASVISIAQSSFQYCYRLTSVTIGTNVTSIGDYAFSVCLGLTNIVIGTNVTGIGNYAFYVCTSLSSVTIPNKVISIGGNAFAGCSSLTSVTIGTNVTSIGTIAFGSCTNLTSVTIPTSVTNIGIRAFAVCTSLTNIAIPKSVTSIGAGAFASCDNLTEITVDPLNLVYSSVDGVLFNRSQTTLIACPGGKTGSYTVLQSVTNIGSSAFSFCTSLTSVTIGTNVAIIGTGAFASCTSLTGLTIPASVTNIGTRAFASCTSLKGVYFKGNAPTAGTTVFASATNAPVYYLPATTGWGATFGGRPTALWLPQAESGGTSFGVQSNLFGFNIAWASGQLVAVDACTNLANPSWAPLQTNLLTGDTFYFSDPDWAHFPARLYRLRGP
jgi:hypothetical protein